MITTIKKNLKNTEVEGYILPHEHLLFDMRPLIAPLDDEDFYKELSLSNFGKVSRNPYAVLDNAAVCDVSVLKKELNTLKKTGANLIVDATTSDFGRDINKLLELSNDTDIHIVAGCGHYTDDSVSDEIKAMECDEIRDNIINDLCNGIDGTKMRAGFIGEIGTSSEMTEFERKSLKAASEAQNVTGCGMHIHASLWTREGYNALLYAVECGADAQKISIDHTDVVLDEEYILRVLDKGAYIEFDNFGKEYYCDKRNRNHLLGSFATDVQRVEFIAKLIEKGYEKQLLITNDICLKSMLHEYGGWGYDHVITNIIPMMKDFGISDKKIQIIMHDNPIKFLERHFVN